MADVTTQKWLARGWDAYREICALKEAHKLAGEIHQLQAADRLTPFLLLDTELEDAIDRLFTIQREILETVETVENCNARILLTERYVNFKTWEQIAKDMCYSLRWVYRMHQRALEQIKSLPAGVC